MSSADILLNNNIKLNVVAETFKYLGVTIGSRLNWEPRISQSIERVSPQIALLNRLAGFLDTTEGTSEDLQTNNHLIDRLWMHRIA